MAAVFKRAETIWGNAFAASSLNVSFDAANNLDVALMQNVNLQYAQNVTRLFEIGTINGKSRVYYIAGRAQGNMGIGRVIGPRANLMAYYEKYGDACAARDNNMRLACDASECTVANVATQAAVNGAVGAANAAVAGRFVFLCGYCVLTSISVGLAAEQFIINESGTLMFSNFEYDGM